MSESAAGGAPSPGLRSVLESQAGRGNPLPDTVRDTLEPRYGADLSDVRVHHDGEAHRMATGLGARAFTYGSDIYFREGAYDPAGHEGRRTLDHEVAHAIQQSLGAPALQRQIEEEDDLGASSALHPTVAEERLATIDPISAEAIDALDVEMSRLVAAADRWLASVGVVASALHPTVGAFRRAVAVVEEARNVMVFDSFAPTVVLDWLHALEAMCARLFDVLEAEGSHSPVDAASLRSLLAEVSNLRTRTQRTLPLLEGTRAEMRAGDAEATAAREAAREAGELSEEDRVREIRARIDALLRGAEILSLTVIDPAQVERARAEIEPVALWLLDPANDDLLGPVWTDDRRILYARRLVETLADAERAAEEVRDDAGEARYASPVWVIALADLLAGSVDVGSETELAILRTDLGATTAIARPAIEAGLATIAEVSDEIREVTLEGVRSAAADRRALVAALAARSHVAVDGAFEAARASVDSSDPRVEAALGVVLFAGREAVHGVTDLAMLLIDQITERILAVPSAMAGAGVGIIQLVLGTPQFIYDLADFLLDDLPALERAESFAASLDASGVDVRALAESDPEFREEILRMDNARDTLARLGETLRLLLDTYRERFANAGTLEEQLFLVGELVAQIVALIRGVRAIRARMGLPSEEAALAEAIADARRRLGRPGGPPSPPGPLGELVPELAGVGGAGRLAEGPLEPSRGFGEADTAHMEGAEGAAGGEAGVAGTEDLAVGESAEVSPGDAPAVEALEWPTPEQTAAFRVRFGHLRGTERWTGALEARYRGLPDAGDAYVWRFDARTTNPDTARLVIARREGFADTAPRRTPVLDDEGTLLRFEDVAEEVRGAAARPAGAISGVEDPAAAASWEIPESLRARLREVLDAREEARLERDLAEAFGETELANDARGRVSAASETVGLEVAREWVSANFPTAVPFEIPGMPTGAGGFDLVYRLPGDRFLIVEAKGGSGRLGWRRGAAELLHQQGTGPYAESIIEDLNLSAPSEELDALAIALRAQRVQYVEVRTPIADGRVDIARGTEFELAPTALPPAP